MTFNEEKYNADVNAYFEKLKELVTNEQLIELFKTWPDKKDYYEPDEIKEQDENKDSGSSEE
jgi:hypothetical protein